MKCAGCGVEQKDAFEYCPCCGAPAPQAQNAPIEDIPNGTVLNGQYRIVGPIARGGMGTVYRGDDIALGRQVAIKVLPSKFKSDPELVERFLREAKAAASLDHPNIVPIYSVGTDQGLSYFVMKLIQGETLSKLIRASALDAGSAMHVVSQICDGLDAIHRAGYVHRDIKSSNVMVDSSGRVTLLDFGVLRGADASAGLTKTGLVMGTPHYIAPEQARDSKLVDHRSDLYALGVVMFEVFAGRLPFIAANVIDVVMKHLTEAPPAPESINPTIPPALSVIVLKALAKKKEERFQSAVEVKIALSLAAQSLGYSMSSGTWSSLTTSTMTGSIPVPTPPGLGVGASVRPQTFSYAPSAFEATVMPSQLPTGPTAFFGEAQVAARTRRKRAYLAGGAVLAALIGGAVFIAVGPKTDAPKGGTVTARGGETRDTPPTQPPAVKPPGPDITRGVSPGTTPSPAPMPPAPAPSPPEVQKGSLIVRKMTEGAKLTVNGKETTVPKDGLLRLEPGKHVIEATKAGHETKTETIEFIAGTKRERSFILERTQPAKPTFGTIRVSASDDTGPLRPFIKVDGNIQPRGTKTIRAKPGVHLVVAELHNYVSQTKRVTVVAGRVATVDFILKKK